MCKCCNMCIQKKIALWTQNAFKSLFLPFFNFFLFLLTPLSVYALIIIVSKITSLVSQTVKRLPTMQETQVWSLGLEDALEKEMATHSSILAWKIPWTEQPGWLLSMGSHRVRHDWATSLSLSHHSFIRRQNIEEIEETYSSHIFYWPHVKMDVLL